MKTFNFVHRWNSLLCPPIGIFFNFLLILLVQTKTPKEMRIHSRILLQTAILDILLLFLTIFGQSVIYQDENATIIYFEGYLVEFFENDDNSLLVFYSIFYTIFMLNIIGIAIQFFYRYLIFNRNITLTLKQYLSMLFFISIPVVIFNIYEFWIVLVGPKLDKNDEKLLLGENEPAKFYISQIAETPLDMYFNIFYIVLLLGCYIVIIFCGWRVAKYVNSNLTGRKKELAKQLSRNLTMMAILPVMFTTITFVAIGISFLVTDVDKEWISTMEMSIFMLIHFIPVLNPLVSIGTNTPYKKAISRMATKVNPVLSTNPQTF